MEPDRQRAEAWLADLTRAQRQRDMEALREERERAEKAETLLRRLVEQSKCPAGATCRCCAAERETLLSEIRDCINAPSKKQLDNETGKT